MRSSHLLCSPYDFEEVRKLYQNRKVIVCNWMTDGYVSLIRPYPLGAVTFNFKQKRIISKTPYHFRIKERMG